MKITKKKVVASSTLPKVPDNAVNYTAAQERIKEAIMELAKCGQTDDFAKEQIANLSVILLDIQSN